MPAKIQNITPCFGFNDCAEKAAKFYVSVFPGAKITGITRCGEGERNATKGEVRTVTFILLGQRFFALNGGPKFTFTHGVSFMVNCDTQKEIDYYWKTLSKGGEKVVCGWLRDKFGVFWQIVPSFIEDLLSDRDPERAVRVMNAVMEMTKLDIAALRAAAKGPPSKPTRRPR